LIADGWPVDLRSRSGLTPLHWAIDADGIPAATLLLDLGADPSLMHPEGFTPLAYAAKRGRTDIETLLKSRGAV
jgi:ankyrin repeat protein